MMKEDDRPVRERIRSRLKRESMEDSGTSFQFDDTGIDDIYTDSRKKMANGLFVPIVGEHSDGHDYIEMAIKNGAVAVLSSRPVDKLKDQYPYVRFYQVKNTVDALQEIGRMERAKFTGTVIGVTGSVGKTTTRNMIAAAISAGKKVFQTAGNANSQIGVPITMFHMARSGADAAVIELGMSKPCEMTKIARVACVDIAVMTNIGIAHIEQLKTQDNILHEKLHILDGMRENGMLFINLEDSLLSRVTIDSIHQDGLIPGKNVLIRGYKKHDYQLHLQVPGDHMLSNASAAMHVALTLGVSEEGAREKLEAFTGVAGRGAFFVTKNGVTVIDDAYNASPVSMKAGLSALAEHEGKRRIAVLADMLELGDKAHDAHREVGQYLATLPIDVVFLYGELAAEIGAGIEEVYSRPEELQDDNTAFPKKKPTIIYFTDFQELRNMIHSLADEGDVVLFKGSNSMKLSTIVEEFKVDKN